MAVIAPALRINNAEPFHNAASYRALREQIHRQAIPQSFLPMMKLRTAALQGVRPGRLGSGIGQKLIANILFNLAGQLYVLVLGIAVVPYIVHRLGSGPYGLTVLVAALGGFAGLLNLGMGTALSKYVAELYWRQDLDRIRRLFHTALAVSLLAGAVSWSLLIGFKPWVASALFHGDGSAERYGEFALYVTAFGVLLSMLTESLSALPMALQRFDICNGMNILLSTLRNLGAVLMLALGLSIRGVLLAYLFASIVGVLGYAYWARRLIPNLSFVPKFAWADFKQLSVFSGSVLLAGLSAVVVHRLDRVVLAYFLPISVVAFYAIPYSLAERTSMGVASVTSVIFSLASELSAMREQARLCELYLRATKMVLLVGLPVTILLVAIPGQILRYYVGAEYANQGAFALQLLAGGFLLNILARVPFAIAQGIGRPWISAKYSVWNAAVNLVCFFIFIPRLGVLGGALGFLISEILVMPLFIAEVNRLVGVSWWVVITRAYLRPFICGFIGLVLLWVLRSYADSLWVLVLYSLLALSTYGLLAFLVALDDRESLGIRTYLSSLWRPAERIANV